MTKDYIYKESNVDIVKELTSFVSSRKFIHKSEIMKNFPAWNDCKITQVASRCSELINLNNGYFMHSSNLLVTEKELYNIGKCLEEYIQDIPVSSRFIYSVFIEQHPDFMRKNNIDQHENLYGILQHLFNDRFYFSRLYIAKSNMEVISTKSIILKRLEKSDEISLKELSLMCYQNEISYANSSKIASIIQPEFIKINSITLKRFECIGLNENVFLSVLDVLQKALAAHDGYLVADKITDFKEYPILNVPWNSVLLESVIAVIPKDIGTVKTLSPFSGTPRTIFVCEDYVDEDWNSFLIKIIKSKHSQAHFSSKSAILMWLRKEGLCRKYPKVLQSRDHVYINESGELQIE